MNKVEGWLLQSYLNKERGMTVWFIDQSGERKKFHLDVEVTFYAAGPFPRLRQLWRFLQAQPIHASLSRQRHSDLFAGPIDLLAVTTDIAQQKKLFYRVLQQFPDIDFYNADLLPSLHLTARHNIFPLAKCLLSIDEPNTNILESIADAE